MPVRTVRTSVILMAIQRFIVITPLGEVQHADDDVDGLDTDEGHDDTAETVDQEVAAENRGSTEGAILNAAQGERNQRHDDQGVEDDRGKNCALRCREMHDVKALQFRIAEDEHRGNNREVFGDVISY